MQLVPQTVTPSVRLKEQHSVRPWATSWVLQWGWPMVWSMALLMARQTVLPWAHQWVVWSESLWEQMSVRLMGQRSAMLSGWR